MSPIWKIFAILIIANGLGVQPNKIAKQQQQQKHNNIIRGASQRQSKRVVVEVFSSCAMNLEVAIGTPAQLFKLNMNFINANALLLMHPVEYSPESKADPAIYNRQTYNPSNSKTFVDLKKNYTDPIFGNGLVGTDVFFFPNARPLAISNGTRLGFILMTNITTLFELALSAVPTDGFLGFGPPQMSTAEGPPSSLAIIASQMKRPPVVTFQFNKLELNGQSDIIRFLFFRENRMIYDGMGVYGDRFETKRNAYDPDEKKQHSQAVLSFDANDRLVELCEPSSWVHMPILNNYSWTVQLDSVFVEKTLFTKNQVAIVDPTWGFLIDVPFVQMKKLAKWLGATKNDAFQVYEIPCNQTGTAPDIMLEFNSLAAAASHSTNNDGSKKFGALFKSTDYIIESELLNDGGTAEGSSKKCQLIFVDGLREWVLGYPFFNKHCLSLDLDMKKHKYNNKSFGQTATVGFAKKKMRIDEH